MTYLFDWSVGQTKKNIYTYISILEVNSQTIGSNRHYDLYQTYLRAKKRNSSAHILCANDLFFTYDTIHQGVVSSFLQIHFSTTDDPSLSPFVDLICWVRDHLFYSI